MKTLQQFNYLTGYKYQGINNADLASKGYKSNQWATYGQWASKDFQVQKGEHGTGIMLVKEDETTKKTVVKWYKVFNLEQVAPLTEQDRELQAAKKAAEVTPVQAVARAL